VSRPLVDRTWPTVGTGSILVVPLGSCEQHGPHLPLDTDTRIAVACANALAARRADVIVAPALTVGASGEHEAFPGTLSIGTDALVEVLVELVRSALPPPTSSGPRPFDGVVMVNGHGGNAEATTRASSRLRGEGRDLLVWHPRIPGGDSHAGRTETSLLLHLDPSAVDMAAAAPGSTARWRDIGDVIRREGLAAVSPNGVLGDPTAATAVEGRRLFESLAGDLVGTVAAWAPTRGSLRP
jgi:mycofactocin precursor peptide peptidase